MLSKRRFLFGTIALLSFAAQSAFAATTVAAWKLTRVTPVWGAETIYTADCGTKVMDTKKGAETLFNDKQNKIYAVNTRARVYSLQDTDSTAKIASLIYSFAQREGVAKRWMKINTKKTILGQEVEGYQCFKPNGAFLAEAWFFTHRSVPAVCGKFMTKFYDIPDVGLECAEMTMTSHSRKRVIIQTKKIEFVTVAANFFEVPKSYKLKADRFNAMGGDTADSIRGFAEDLMDDSHAQAIRHRSQPKAPVLP